MNAFKTSYGLHHLCLILLSLATSSCLPDPLEVDGIPTLKSEIVVASLIVPGQGVVVLLTKTIGALEASEDSDPEELLRQISVDDAIVVISGSNSVDTLNFIESGVYGGVDVSFVNGAIYELFVSSESLGTVTASTIMKPQILFETAEAELYYNEFDDTLAYIAYSLNDPAMQNWYMINVQEVEQEDLVENIINPRAYTLLFKDSTSNEQVYKNQFLAYPRDYAPEDTIALSLSNISEEYYNFMKFRMDNRYSFLEFIGEPVNYPSNVIGGRGFFNLYLPDVRTFVFEE